MILSLDLHTLLFLKFSFITLAASLIQAGWKTQDTRTRPHLSTEPVQIVPERRQNAFRAPGHMVNVEGIKCLVPLTRIEGILS